MKFICPLITVENIERSKRFYIDILNQEIEADFGENVSFKNSFAIHLRSHYEKLINNKAILSKSNNFELYFEEDNLEGVVQKLTKHQVEFVHALREEPWKQRVVRFYDPDYNIIEIGESLENLIYRLYNENKTPEEISTLTYLSEEYISKAISKF